jgi:hypothetical protein
MRKLAFALSAFVLLPALGPAQTKAPELKKVEVNKEIRARLDVIEKLVGADFPVTDLPAETKTLDQAYMVLLAKKQKQEREALDLVFKDATTVYALEFTVGKQKDTRRTVFVFSRTADFKQMLYAYSPLEKGGRWMVTLFLK